jgi:hypothetical protein
MLLEGIGCGFAIRFDAMELRFGASSGGVAKTFRG